MSETKNISLHGLRTFLQPLIRLINRKAESWEDLKGKPFGSTYKEVELLKNTQFYAGDQWMPLGYFAFVEGQNYTVIFDGETYNCIAYRDEYGTIDIGDITLAGDNHPQSQDAPFFICSDEGYGAQIFFENPDIDHTISISTNEEVIKKLDSKYIDVDLPEGILTQDNYLETTAGMQVGDNGEIFNNYSANYASYMAHAEGSGTTAGAPYSHAEGQGTNANGNHSHAEGYYTKATEDHSHAEGNHTISSGISSHAEGSLTTAKGWYAHAEGNNSYASGEASHAEGIYSYATGNAAHAEGKYTKASSCAHAEGFGLGFDITFGTRVDTYTYTYSSLSANDSNADITKCDSLFYQNTFYGVKEINTQENKITLNSSMTLSSSNKSAFLFQSGAEGSYSHVEGLGTTATGEGSHAEGKISNAIGAFSHAEGEGSSAIGISSHAEGRGQSSTLTLVRDGSGRTYIYSNATFTPSVGDALYYHNVYYYIKSVDTANSKIVLDGVITTTSTFVALHYQGGAFGYYSHKEGNYSNANGDNSHAEGSHTVALAINSHAEGENSVAEGVSSHAEGNLTTASASYSHAEGNETTASATAAHAEGKSTTASGHSSHAEGANTTASGTCSHAEGVLTTASGDRSHVEGTETTAQGDNSHAEGITSIASGTASHAEGNGSQANGENSHAEGYKTLSIGAQSHSEGYSNISGLSIKLSGKAYTCLYTYSGDIFTSFCVGAIITVDKKVYATIRAINQSTKTILVNKTLSIQDLNNAICYLCRGVAYGDNSHSEGWSVNASGVTSHAEGMTTIAYGQYSHAEGKETKALGEASHAQGIGTITTTYASNVIGKYNVDVPYYTLQETHGNIDFSNGSCYVISEEPVFSEDMGFTAKYSGTKLASEINVGDIVTTSTTVVYANNSSGILVFTSYYKILSAISDTVYQYEGASALHGTKGYAHIVGNGDSDTTRSNAHTLDWSGNGWYQTSVCVGGTDGDSPAASLAANGLILTDETTGTKYRVYINNAKLTMEVIS